MPTVEKQCSCTNEFQDHIYGRGIRLFNLAGKDGKFSSAHCTTCGKAISLGGGDSPRKPQKK